MPPTNAHIPEDKKSTHKQSPQTNQPTVASTSLPHIQRDMDISRMNPSQVLSLQRSIGNQAVQRMLGSARSTPITPHASSTPVIQAKLEVGPVGDRYEQEADRIAAEVVKGPATAQPAVQRKIDKNGVQMKSELETIQRAGEFEEEEEQGSE